MGTGLLYGTLMAVLASFAICANVSDRQRLVTDLTSDYVTGVEPDPTDFKMGLSILCATYDVLTGELVTSAWERTSWTDSRLSWNPDDYDGITMIRIPSENIWTPDLKLYNSLRTREERPMTHTVVSSDGTVLWIPPVVYRTPCSQKPSAADESDDKADFDCRISIGSWVYDANTLKLKLMDDKIDRSSYMNDTCPLTIHQAEISVHTKKYPCCDEPYSNIRVDLQLNRRRNDD